MQCESCGLREAVADASISRICDKRHKREYLTPIVSLCRPCIRKVCRAAGLDFPPELEDNDVPDIFEENG